MFQAGSVLWPGGVNTLEGSNWGHTECPVSNTYRTPYNQITTMRPSTQTRSSSRMHSLSWVIRPHLTEASALVLSKHTILSLNWFVFLCKNHKSTWVLWEICILLIFIFSEIHINTVTNLNDTSDKNTHTQKKQIHRNITINYIKEYNCMKKKVSSCLVVWLTMVITIINGINLVRFPDCDCSRLSLSIGWGSQRLQSLAHI